MLGLLALATINVSRRLPMGTGGNLMTVYPSVVNQTGAQSCTHRLGLDTILALLRAQQGIDATVMMWMAGSLTYAFNGMFRVFLFKAFHFFQWL